MYNNIIIMHYRFHILLSRPIIFVAILLTSFPADEATGVYDVPKNETRVILNILYSCKSIAMKFSM